MKKILFILSSIVLTFVLNAQTITMSSASKGIIKRNDQFSGFQATFSYNQIESTTITGTERGTFSAINIEGAMSVGEVGTPQLPVFKKLIAVPVGATPKVVVKNYTTTEYNLDEYGIQTIYPVQPSVPKNIDLKDVPFAYSEKAYNANEYTRSSIAQVEVLGTMRGVIIGMLAVYPVQYNPVTHSIITYNNIDIEVVFENGDYEKTQTLFRNTYSPYFDELYKTRLFNRNIFDDHPDLYKTPVHMLVLAHSMFTSTLQPWFEWKTKKGFYVDVQYVDGQTYTQLKTLCQTKYNAGVGTGTAPTFVVIVGDIQQVPASKTGAGTDGNKGSDLYYGSIDGDYFPEMYYSRLSAQNTQQLANQIEKILYYEKYQFADPTYLDNVLLIAGQDGSGWNPNVAQPTINYAANNYYNTAHGYANIYKYLSSYTNCYSNLNNVGFANYTAHGSITAWSGPSYSVSDVDNLTNVNKYFIAMGNCCLAADFNSPECLGEAMMRAQQKGAVGYIGSCPLTYWHDDLHFAVGAYSGTSWSPAAPTFENTMDGLYDLAFGDADFNCLSSWVFAGNLNVTYAIQTPGITADTQPIYYWEAYNVLGDGSLMPYNTQGSNNTVTHMPVIYIGLPSFEVMAVPGSYVAISKDGVLLGTAVANTSGVATVTLDPPITSGGNVDIVVTRNQYKPYIQQIQAVAQSGPYIVPAGYTVPGDEILTYISTNTEIEVTLKNVGIETTDNLTVTISCTDPQLTITNNTATCSGIAPDGSAIVKFNVTVAHDIPDNKTFMVDVTSTEGGKASWEGKLPLIAYAPVFSLDKVLIDGVEDGNLPAGSVATITTVIKNKGGADAYNVKGKIEITSEFVTLACEEIDRAVQNLPAGETLELTFTVITSPEMPYGHEALVNLLLTANYGISATETFKVTYSGSTSYCSNGTQNCNSDDKFTLVQLYKTSVPANLLINNNNTTCLNSTGYHDYTATEVALEPGQQYTIKLKIGIGGTQGVRGWIDYNSNKDFENNELVFDQTCSSSSQEYTQNFTIPENAASGSLRFRLICKYSGTPTPCNNTSYGQTHDYTIVLPNLYPSVKNVEAVFNEGEKKIVVTWDAPTEGTPDSYNIYRNGNVLNSTPITATTFTETNIESGIYAYSVVAMYGTHESSPKMSNVICNIITCETPVNLTATQDCHNALLEWEDLEGVEGVLGYNVYRNYQKINDALIIEKEYLDENLETGEYKYQVSAKYEDCESDLTDEVTLVILPCEMPQDLQVELDKDKDLILVTWEPPVDVDRNLLGYNLYRNEEKINTDVIIEQEYEDKDLTPETDYCYKVSAVYSFGESDKTDPKCVHYVGINDYQDGAFKLFPNPTNGELRVESGELRVDNIEIFDVYGRMQNAESRMQKADGVVINISNLPAGVYFVKINTEAGTVVKKIIKN